MSIKRFHVFAARPAAHGLAIALLSAAALAACSQDEPVAPAPAVDEAPVLAPTPAEDPVAQTAPAADGATTGGDGSQITLDGITEADLEGAPLAGELACAFSEAGQQPLLLAKGSVGSDEPAQGIVKVAGHVEQVRAPGGYDGMLDGPTFTGQGKTIRIEETGPATAGGESPPRPATLTYMRADGAERVFSGQWQCGP